MCIKLDEGNPLIPFTCAGYAIAEEAKQVILSLPRVYEEYKQLDGCDLSCRAITLIGSSVAMVFSLAMLVFETVIDFFFDTKAYLLDQRTNRLDPEAVAETITLKLNRARAGDAPLPIDPIVLDPQTSEIPLEALLEQFDKISSTIERPVNIRRDLEEFIRRVDSGCNPYSEHLQGVLKLFIAELRKPELSLEKKKTALLAIAEASHQCPPRTYDECLRQLKILTNRYPNLEQLLLSWIQFFKEEVLLEKYQDTQFHMLNEARQRLPDWGLDSDPINLSDPHTSLFGGGPFVGPLNYRYVLNKELSPARLVAAIRNRVLQDEYNNSFITKFLESREADLPTDWQTQFFSEGKINYRGIAWILVRLEFLTT